MKNEIEKKNGVHEFNFNKCKLYKTGFVKKLLKKPHKFFLFFFYFKCSNKKNHCVFVMDSSLSSRRSLKERTYSLSLNILIFAACSVSAISSFLDVVKFLLPESVSFVIDRVVEGAKLDVVLLDSVA